MLKFEQLRLEIGRRPEQDPVEILAPNRADQSLYEGVRNRHARHSLDLGYVEYPKVRLPLMESVQRVMIRAEVFRRTLPANRPTKHPVVSGNSI
jgi:hypothetical protein